MNKCPRCKRKINFKLKEILLYNFSKNGYLKCSNCGDKLLKLSKEYLVTIGVLLIIPIFYSLKFEVEQFKDNGILVMLFLIIINILLYFIMFSIISYLIAIKTNKWKSQLLKPINSD